ncbi:MAG: alanine racemase [Candidatus Liptonbacteria bacterium]|nr:alanine racemase [Candidatus Liptonbacteria bacterium]
MSARKLSRSLRTWVEIDRSAIQKNCETFRSIIGPDVKLLAVVKSNAYGHGLTLFSGLVENRVDGFCVDSAVEGIRVREFGIRKPILILGPTLPDLYDRSASEGLTVSISNHDALRALMRCARAPDFHLKIDTGMHRQGFSPHDVPKIFRHLKKLGESFRGVYTHFASAKDVNYPTFTEKQYALFSDLCGLLRNKGFDTPARPLIQHCAATGATLLGKKYHLDAVRVGIGLYGLYPSKELEIQLPMIKLRPVLSWRTMISEIKFLAPGDYVGYDLAERLSRPTKIAVLPIGYWHGFPRSLSSTGIVLINGRSARVLGRVSMDLVTVDATGIRCRVGDTATIIGKDARSERAVDDAARASGTIHYEFLTRLNPLMERVLT